MNKKTTDDSQQPLVLVADDDDFMRDMVAENVQSLGYRVVFASTGRGAIDMARQAAPDLVLMDGMMPEMDGFEACRVLTESPETADIPVLMLTMMDDDDSIERGFDAGAVDYITKPFRWSTLARRLSNIVQRRRAEKEHARLEQRLRQMHKKEAISQLTAGIAHEFNNILASIIGYSQLAIDRQSKLSEGKLAYYLEEINTAGVRGRKLVEQMITYSRGASSEQRMEHLEPIVEKVLSLVRPSIPERIDLATSFQNDLPETAIDFDLLEQVLMNLCLNARDAISSGGTITVALSQVHRQNLLCSSCQEPVQGSFVELSVSDDGDGMSSDVLRRIFDPFFTTRNHLNSSGMGLPVADGIVHDHNGHIVVESRPGGGSRFSILLPTVAIEIAEPRAPAEAGERPGRDGHVLVVDDEPALARFLADLLQSRGYKVTMASCASDALEAFESHSSEFDLLLTDQSMPGMDGMELSSRIRAIRPDIPVILFSGYSDELHQGAVSQTYINAFMSKPADSRVLIKKVDDLIKS
jgi:CheY-like chemotaxis protein